MSDDIAGRITVDATALANLFGLTERRVQQLHAERVIVRTAPGVYDLEGSIKGYVAYLRDRADSKGGLSKERYEEQFRKLRAERISAELEVEERRERLWPVAAVVPALEALATSARAQMLSIPSKLKARFPDLPLETIEAMELLHREALEELSRERLPSDLVRAVDRYHKEVEAAAKVDSKRVGRRQSRSQS